MIYLDNSATTKICDEALETYLRVSTERFGNPSSLHTLGMDAENVLRDSRKTILKTLGVKDGTLVFTASGSEGNNLAIFGRAYAKERFAHGKILTTDGEHASVGSPLEKLAEEGFRIVKIPTRGGILDMDRLREELTPDVILVTMMAVNNETGAHYDLSAVKREMTARCPDALLHADATQAYLKVPVSPKILGADLITISSHKIEGPKGVGALYISDAVVKNRGLSPQILGGGQEGGFRSGTENVPGIAAFATAALIGFSHLSERAERMNTLRQRTLAGVFADPELSAVSPTLPPKHAPHILNITLPGIKSETMLHFLSAEGICVSSGSACSSHHPGVSSALVAFGRTEAEADCSIRISFSHRNTEEDVDALLAALKSGLGKLARIGGRR